MGSNGQQQGHQAHQACVRRTQQSCTGHGSCGRPGQVQKCPQRQQPLRWPTCMDLGLKGARNRSACWQVEEQ